MNNKDIDDNIKNIQKEHVDNQVEIIKLSDQQIPEIEVQIQRDTNLSNYNQK